MPSTPVVYRNRRGGTLIVEQILGEKPMRWLYETALGYWLLNAFLIGPTLSQLCGRWYDRPASRHKIPDFIHLFNLNLAEIELPPEAYPTFNAFFARRLRPEARPFDISSKTLCSPGDGKLLVFPSLDHKMQMPIKGGFLNLGELLADPVLTQKFNGGAALILRLAPYDYHRFHFPDSGLAESARLITGQYHSVNPIALARLPHLFALNKRMVMLLHSDHFGDIGYLEIGALNVGSIVQTYIPGRINKGQEKGLFQFGGSTLVLLFEPNRICFEADLQHDSADGIEVQVLCGEHIGTSA